MHVLVAWQVFQELFVIVRVLWCVVIVQVVLAELVPVVMAVVADVMGAVCGEPVCLVVALNVGLGPVRVGVVVLVGLGLVHSVLSGDLRIGLVVVCLLLGRVVRVFGLAVEGGEVLALWVLYLHGAWLVLIRLLVNLLLLKHPCNVLSVVPLPLQVLNSSLQALDQPHFILNAFLNQIQIARSIRVPFIDLVQLVQFHHLIFEDASLLFDSRGMVVLEL